MTFVHKKKDCVHNKNNHYYRLLKFVYFDVFHFVFWRFCVSFEHYEWQNIILRASVQVVIELSPSVRVLF